MDPKELTDIFKALKDHHFIPAFKAVLAKKRGPTWLLVRPPLIPLQTAQAEALFSKEPHFTKT